MQIQDDRTDSQRETHPFLVIGTDTFLSGWGKAEGGVSYAAWACPEQWLPHVFDMVRARRDMRRVRTTSGKWSPRGRGHAHIYVVTPEHVYAPSWAKNHAPQTAT